MIQLRSTLILVICGALAASACKKKEGTGEGSATPPAGSAAPTAPADAAAVGSAMGSAAAGSGSAAPAATLTDPQIAAIVVAANTVDIEAGKLAAKKTKNAEVKKFAELMVKDHTAVNKSAVDLVTKLKVTPEETDTSKGLTSSGADTRAKLEKLDGAEFDRAYVDNEVAYHEAVINVLKTQLIPSASNQELKDALVGVQPAFDAHLQHAKQIQATLAGGGSAAGSGMAHDHGAK
jgi:putative membrane protein